MRLPGLGNVAVSPPGSWELPSRCTRVRCRLSWWGGGVLNSDVRCRMCGEVVPDSARFCPACATPLETGPPIDERKVATVLFADLVGSTQLGESQDPERTRVLLERLFKAMSEEIERTGGTVDKFIGDAVMAAFGVPL